jgi:hypothetical protein
LPAASDWWRPGKRRLSVLVGCSLLRLPERAGDVTLAERATRPGGEHERVGSRILCGALVAGEDERELARDRHGSCGAVGLGRPTVPMTVDLKAERDLRVVEVVKTNLCPSEAAQLGYPGRSCDGPAAITSVLPAVGVLADIGARRSADRVRVC